MGVIHECGGKMHMQERDWESGKASISLCPPLASPLACLNFLSRASSGVRGYLFSLVGNHLAGARLR